MEDAKPVVVSKVGVMPNIGGLYFTLLSAAMIIGAFIGKNAAGNYLLLFFAFGFLLLAVYVFYLAWFCPLAIYGDRSVISYGFLKPAKTIFLKDINSYMEIGGGKGGPVLKLYTNQGEFLIPSGRYGNYQELKNNIIKNVPYNDIAAEKLSQSNLKSMVIFLIFVLVVFALLFTVIASRRSHL